MENINTVIFDMDGVIVDGMPYHIKSWKEALSTIDMHVTDLEIYLIGRYDRQGNNGNICQKK